MTEHRDVELGGLSVVHTLYGKGGTLTVRMSASSRYPGFEPAKTQRRDRVSATTAQRKGKVAMNRMMKSPPLHEYRKSK